MKNNKRLKLLVVAIAVLGASIGIGVMSNLGGVASGHPTKSEAPPPPPPWLGQNGVVDMSKVPAWVPVWGREDTPRGWVRGTDMFSGDSRPIPMFDHPDGRQIGRVDSKQ